ncbi:MAG TPA: hypothetical protein VK893_12495 [Pyrinomonadaceae bacterium]|nr:hypothetical protein [Pyrinomonadaceae bacterium]
MKLNYSSKKVGGYILALFLILGFTTIASTNVQAQYPRGYERRDRDDRYRRDRDWDRNNRRRGRNGFEVARQQGYSYGMNVGAADAQRRQSYNPQRSRYWKKATEGYSSSFGNKDQYKRVFRNAFEQGYRQGWQQFAGYNRRDRWGRRY